jgi:hypothetical protein
MDNTEIIGCIVLVVTYVSAAFFFSRHSEHDRNVVRTPPGEDYTLDNIGEIHDPDY